VREVRAGARPLQTECFGVGGYESRGGSLAYLGVARPRATEVGGGEGSVGWGGAETLGVLRLRLRMTTPSEEGGRGVGKVFC
jgi:hypothetical protein